MSDWPYVDKDYPEEDWPKLIERDEELASDEIDNDLMKRIVTAEKALKAWRPDAKITPWEKSITRNHENISWVTRYGVKVTLKQEGIPVTSIVAI